MHFEGPPDRPKPPPPPAPPQKRVTQDVPRENQGRDYFPASPWPAGPAFPRCSDPECEGGYVPLGPHGSWLSCSQCNSSLRRYQPGPHPYHRQPGEWHCPCGYSNFGVICTKCGRVPVQECPACGPHPCSGPHPSD